MREMYRENYGANGTLLYPSRAADFPEFEAVPERITRNDQAFTVVFAGTVNSLGYVRALAEMAAVLEPVSGRLLVFGPLTHKAARQADLERPNIELRGLVTAPELIIRLREEGDALFVPMSFGLGEASNMRMGFPSKLTDYTAAGLPLLIYGPDYCSAVCWARENPGVAEVVDTENVELLAEAVSRLAQDPEHRVALGRRALEVGRRYFTHEAAQRVFREALLGGRVFES